jgi:hypothetical protein
VRRHDKPPRDTTGQRAFNDTGPIVAVDPMQLTTRRLSFDAKIIRSDQRSAAFTARGGTRAQRLDSWELSMVAVPPD